MHKIWVTGLAASIGLAGWATLAVADLFSAKGPVIAILADELFLGEAEGHLSGAGTLAIRSQKNSAVSCLGQFTSSAALGGSGRLQCSDGATATFHFQRLSIRSGYGAGSFSRGSVSFTYGLAALESESYLKLPSGKKLAHSGNKLELVEISPQPVAPAKSAVTVAQAVAPAKSAVAAAPAVAPSVRPKSPPGKEPGQNEKKLELVEISPPQAVAVAPAKSAVAVPQAVTPAQDVAPDVLLNAVTSEVIAIIKQDGDIQDGNPAKVAALVETRILPHFDFARMTQTAMGRNWPLATPEQQKALTLEFKTLLVRTYSTALSSYRDEVIEYKPLRVAPDATEVTVKSEVRQPGKERLTIDYDMERTPAGWKVYNIKIAGISLVTTYRETFAGRVRDGGIEGLIKSLSDKNRQGGFKTVNSER